MTAKRNNADRTIRQLEMKLAAADEVLRAAQLQTQIALANEAAAAEERRKIGGALWVRQAEKYGLKMESGKLRILFPADSEVCR